MTLQWTRMFLIVVWLVATTSFAATTTRSRKSPSLSPSPTASPTPSFTPTSLTPIVKTPSLHSLSHTMSQDRSKTLSDGQTVTPKPPRTRSRVGSRTLTQSMPPASTTKTWSSTNSRRHLEADSATMTLTNGSRQLSGTHSYHPMLLEGPLSASSSTTASVTLTKRLRQYQGQCRVSMSVGSDTVEKRFMRLSDTVGGSPNDASTLIPYYYITAIDFRAHGLVMLVALENPDKGANATEVDDGVPTFTVATPYSEHDVDNNDASSGNTSLLSGAFVLSVKDAMYSRMVGSADTVTSNRLFSEGNSQEGHGVLYILAKRQAVIGTATNGNQTLAITMQNFVSYRVAADEWIVVNFFNNATDPFNCASAGGQIVIQIATYEFLPLQDVTSILCFIAMLTGLAASFVGTPLALSQHAGAVSLLSLLHFAQEDGAKLPLAINIFQASIGTTKYRYVVGVLVVQTSVIAFLVIVHYLAARWVIPWYKGLNVYIAQALVRHPALSVAVVLHVAPGMWFAFGRNLGHQSSEQYVLNFACFSVTAYLTWVGFRDLVSASMSVRYLPHKDRSGRLIDHGFHDELIQSVDTGGDIIVERTVDDEGVPIRIEHSSSVTLEAFVQDEEAHFDATMHRPHRYLILREAFYRHTPSWARRLLLWLDEEHGVWRSIDPLQTFIASRGHAIYNYTKRGRLWMGFEQLDVFLVALLTLVDNYTPQLAAIQFGITLAVKIVMFLAAVGLRPARRTYAALLLLLLYFFEMCAALALTISALRAELVPVCEIVQTVSCFACSIILVLEILCATLIGSSTAILRIRRRQAFLSTSRGRDTLDRFTTRVDSGVFVEGVDLIDGVLVDSELGRQAIKRRGGIEKSDHLVGKELLSMPAAATASAASLPPVPLKALSADATDAPPLSIIVKSPRLNSAAPPTQPKEFDEDVLDLVDGVDEGLPTWSDDAGLLALHGHSSGAALNVVDLLLQEDERLTSEETHSRSAAPEGSGTYWWRREDR